MPEENTPDIDTEKYNAGLERFIKEAGLTDEKASVLREGAAHVDPKDFGDWLDAYISGPRRNK